MPASSSLRGIICMVLAAFTFVTNDCFLKLAVAEAPPLQSLFLRGMIATIWCLMLNLAMGHGRQLYLAYSPWTIARSLCEAVAVTSFIFGLAHVPLADITAIYQLAPLIVLAGASIVWREQIDIRRWLLIGCGVSGALLVAQPGAAGASPYILLGFITAFLSAARDLLSRKVPDRAPGLVVAFSVVTIVMAVSGIASLLFEDMIPVGKSLLGYSLGSGFFLVFGQFFAFMAFRLASARAVAPFYYCITLFAVLYGVILFKEVPNSYAILGIALIVSCGLGVLLLERRGKEIGEQK